MLVRVAGALLGRLGRPAEPEAWRSSLGHGSPAARRGGGRVADWGWQTEVTADERADVHMRQCAGAAAKELTGSWKTA